MWTTRIILVSLCLTLASSAFAAGVPVNEASDDQKAAATSAYKSGRTSFDDRRFVDALKSFRESYDVVASPNTHLMIAHTLRELGRNAEAYQVFGDVAEEARAAASADPKYNESADLALKEQSLLREHIGLVKLEVVGASDTARLTVEGRVVERAAWSKPVAVDPGKATFLLTTDGEPVVREIEVTAGGEQALRLDAVVKEESAPPPVIDEGFDWLSTWRVVAYGVAGAGVLSFAAAGGVGAAALSQHDELEEACGGGPCPERRDDIDRGRTLQTASNALVIVGAGLVAAGVVLWFVAPEIEGEASAEASVGLRIHHGSLTLTGRF